MYKCIQMLDMVNVCVVVVLVSQVNILIPYVNVFECLSCIHTSSYESKSPLYHRIVSSVS